MKGRPKEYLLVIFRCCLLDKFHTPGDIDVSFHIVS